MRRKISLYIAGQPVDLDEQSFILFNYTMEDMSNPTIVRNSFSQSITLQGTPRNNKIFGSIFRADRQTQYADSFTGVHFDPARKTPFIIYNEMNEILEEGYLKLNKVSRKKAGVEYNITLYGGLGSFFYGLMYKDDGSKKTLADLSYLDRRGNKVSLFNISPEAQSVKDAWSHFEGVSLPHYDFWNIINFTPAYNGIPENFDAAKALYLNKNIYMNLPVRETKDGVEYSLKSDASTRLMKFANPHSEWEICDLRWYLQRPAMSIKAIINAICDPENNGGYQVTLDDAFFNTDNPYYNDAWMTMQMIAAEDRNSTECLNNLLKSSVSPAEILISFAKIYGLVFLYNTGEKKVSIMLRKTFYQSDSMIDLTSRIQRSDIEVNPLVADSLIYQFGDKAIGQFAEEYKKDYQREYGIQKVNTGYEFNAATTILTKDLAFKDSVEVMEVNRMFVSKWGRYSNKIQQSFYLPAYEEVSVQLWATTTDEEGNSEQSEDFPITTRLGGLTYDNPNYEYGDWLPKVQLHKDKKPEDGSYTLLFFSGIKESPIGFGSMRKPYWLTNDHPDMNLLNDNTPCWNLTGEEIEIKTLPSFRKNLIASDGKTIEASWEWGVPFARAVPGIEGNNTIYENWWKNYLQDLYDDDTRKMTCKVDLRGLFVNQTLMRRMFWYDNSLWRLNKIINHSLTTWDDTECEFIKVQDIDNYIG